MIELKGVSVKYSNGVDALNNVDLKVTDGEFVFVVGNSGAGKSTLIKLLLREVQANEGEVLVNGFNLTKMRRGKIPALRRTIGVVFQDFRLIPTLNVYDNIAFVLRCTDASPKVIRQRVPKVIGTLELGNKIKCFPNELSGGEQQRVALARALVNEPKLIIADEPTGNIDPRLSFEIVKLLQEINDQGTTVLMVTHEHDLVREFGGRTITLKDGSIVFDDYI
ncbi:MAG: cell division ATP-binding protein FtsE [Ruminococcus sp.]|nr:cell division ATP-binding protein FtsE [Ruminococcus sp.]